jgi:hypothetical protein
MTTKQTFTEWWNEKNTPLIIISILLVYILERFTKSMHTDVVTPIFHECVKTTVGWNPQEIKNSNSKKWKKIVVHFLELAFSIFILFLLSRFVFSHTLSSDKLKQLGQEKTGQKKREEKPIIIYFQKVD